MTLATTEAYGLRFYYPEKDTAVGACLRDSGEFARAELDLLLACAEGRGAFLDVGANIGAIGLPFAAQRPDWQVICVEAHRPLSNVLAANAVVNGLGNVEVVNAAAGAAPGVAVFSSYPLSAGGNFGSLRFGTGGPGEPVRVTTIDEIAPPDTRLVKIDIEGFEAEALKGAQELLRARRAAWVLELNPSRDAVSRQCIATLLEAGYSLFWLYVPFVLPKPVRGDAAFDLRQGDLNLLALAEGAPPWDLPAVTAADVGWPTYNEVAGYLRRYPRPS